MLFLVQYKEHPIRDSYSSMWFQKQVVGQPLLGSVGFLLRSSYLQHVLFICSSKIGGCQLNVSDWYLITTIRTACIYLCSTAFFSRVDFSFAKPITLSCSGCWCSLLFWDVEESHQNVSIYACHVMLMMVCVCVCVCVSMCVCVRACVPTCMSV